MWNDPIIEELHQVRSDRAIRFNGDLKAMVDSLKPLEEEWLSRFPDVSERLLPKLVSGGIRVEEAEEMAGELL